jgi:hypothetical protein
MRFARSVPCAIRSSTRHRRTTETKAAFKTTELMAYVAPSSQEAEMVAAAFAPSVTTPGARVAA